MKKKGNELKQLVTHMVKEISSVKENGLTFVAFQQNDDYVKVLLKTFDFKSGKNKILAEFQQNMKYLELEILSMVDEIENGTDK